MFGFIIRRCLGAIPVLILVTVFAFALIKAAPGDPIDILLGGAERDLPPAQLTALRAEMGLDKPFHRQYLSWLSGFWGRGELGRSYRDGRPVLEVIAERCPATLALVGAALVIAFSAGIFFGALMAAAQMVRSWQPVASVLVALALIFYSAPSFWLGFLSLFVVGQWLPEIPFLGLHEPGEPLNLPDLFAHLLLPALLLSTRRAAKVALFVRSVMLDELRKEYVIVAMSKGLSFTAVLVRHTLRNSMLPVVTLLGLSLPALLGGSVLIETVFSWPGMGRLAVEAAFGRNYPLLLSLVTVYGALVVASSLVADLLYGVADPRLKDGILNGQAASAAVGGGKR